MNVHNIMEDVVQKSVNNFYDQVKASNTKWLTCDCENCRLDTVSYVLNRIPAKYVVSGRGVTHAADTLNDHQLKADIEALILEGMRIVSSTKRPFHKNDRKECAIAQEAIPCYNFSTITGTILDGSTFEPVINATVLLKVNGKEAEMIDKTWINPYITCKSTRGAYNFWVKPMETIREGTKKTFKMELDVSAEGYSPLKYFFEIPLVSEPQSRTEIDSTFTLKLRDLVLFKSDIENEMDN